jgi:hypothetical protein
LSITARAKPFQSKRNMENDRMLRFRAIFLHFAPAFAVLLTCTLATTAVDAAVAITPGAINGTATGSTLAPLFSANGATGTLDVFGEWTVTGNGSNPVSTFYDFVTPSAGSVSLTTGQSYQITNLLDLELSGLATSGSYSATTFLDSSSSSTSRVSGASAIVSGSFSMASWSGSNLFIDPSMVTSTFSLSGSSGSYYLEQDVTISLNGVNPGQGYLIALPGGGSDDSGISPAPAATTPEPPSFAVWAGLGVIGMGAWGARRRPGRQATPSSEHQNARLWTQADPRAPDQR